MNNFFKLFLLNFFIISLPIEISAMEDMKEFKEAGQTQETVTREINLSLENPEIFNLISPYLIDDPQTLGRLAQTCRTLRRSLNPVFCRELVKSITQTLAAEYRKFLSSPYLLYLHRDDSKRATSFKSTQNAPKITSLIEIINTINSIRSNNPFWQYFCENLYQNAMNQLNIVLYDAPYLITDESLLIEILRTGANPNYVNPDNGSTPLHKAIMAEKIDFVQILLKYNANINAQDNEGNTPLHKAIWNEKRIDTIKYLLDQNPDLTILNKNHEIALDLLTTIIQTFSILPQPDPDYRDLAMIMKQKLELQRESKRQAILEGQQQAKRSAPSLTNLRPTKRKR